MLNRVYCVCFLLLDHSMMDHAQHVHPTVGAPMVDHHDHRMNDGAEHGNMAHMMSMAVSYSTQGTFEEKNTNKTIGF